MGELRCGEIAVLGSCSVGELWCVTIAIEGSAIVGATHSVAITLVTKPKFIAIQAFLSFFA